MRRHVFQFGGFQLDIDARVLWRADGQLVVLPARMFECIAWLIEHRDRAVGRDELIAAVWNSTEPSDNLLAQLIFRTRKLLDDPSDTQSAIRTVPGFGYQWAAPTRVLEEPDVAVLTTSVNSEESDVPDSAPLTPTIEATLDFPARRHIKWKIAALTASVLLVVVASYVWRRSIDLPASDLGSSAVRQREAGVIAVLPVGGAATSDAEWAWLRLGLMDLIANRLREHGQPVVPSSDVVAVVRDERKPDAAADRYHTATSARYVLLTTALRSDNGWIVHLELRDRNGPTREVQASAPEVIGAAKQAADLLLARIGKTAAPETGTFVSASATELLQRAEAAVLDNRFDDARRLLESAPGDLRNNPDVQLRLAQIDFRTGRLETAQKGFEALLTTTSEEKDVLTRARALNGLGAIDIRFGHADAAERKLTDSIRLLAESNESATLGSAYLWRGNAFAMQGHYDRTQADWAKARIAFGKAGDVLSLARVDADEGVLQTHLFHFEEAVQLFRQAADQFERFGVNDDLAAVRGNEISSQLELLQPAAALATAAHAGTRFDKLGNPLRAHWFTYEHARALLANGRLVEARNLLDVLAREIQPGETGLLAMVQAAQAKMHLSAGESEAALALAQSALAGLPPAEAKADQWSDVRISAWQILIRALGGLDRDEEASTEIGKFRAWAEASGDSANVVQARLIEGEQVWSEGHREAAIAIYDDLLSILPRTGGSPAYVSNVLISYGNLLIGSGYTDRASAVVGQLARYADRDFDCALLQVRLYHALGQRDAWQAALDRARSLAGERMIPPLLTKPPE